MSYLQTITRPAALSFDTELWHEGDWMQKYITPTLKSKPDGFSESIHAIMAILEQYGHKATFFVTGPVLDSYPDVIRSVSDAGHEIGSHCFRHVRLDTLSESEIGDFEWKMGEHVRKIQDITSKHPKGFRAPHFSLSQKSSWLLPMLNRLGFIYDSSLFPVKMPQYGIGNAPQIPYRISFENIALTNPQSPILEIPPATVSFGSHRFPAAGGIYFRLMPGFMFSFLLKRASDPLPPVTYFHPHELWAETPQIKGPALKTFLKYMGTSDALGKFELLCKQFSFDSIANSFNL